MKKRIVSLAVAMLLIVNAMCFFDIKADACTTQGGIYYGWSELSYSYVNPDVHRFDGEIAYYCKVCKKTCYYNYSGTESHTYLLSGDMRTLTCNKCGDSYGW